MAQERFTLGGVSKVKTREFELRGQALPFIAASSLRGDPTDSVALPGCHTVDGILFVPPQ